MSAQATVEVPGLNLPRLGRWFVRNLPGAGEHLSATVVAGGKSNLTYVVTDGLSEWIVRRPPLGHVLATAHNMSREFRVMSALQGTDVPVPRTHAFCRDESVVGSDFYVMERVIGTPYRRAGELAALGEERVAAIGDKLVDVLASLHALNPDVINLSDFGRPDGFLCRQVARWKKQLDASCSRELPPADELHALLKANVPDASPASIVHGDYRLDNLLVDDDDQVRAVLDWEMATVGDPLTDLALMVTYNRMAEVLGEVVTDVSLAPGFPSESAALARYASASGRDLSDFGFYLGLAAFKLAVIFEGIHYRHISGLTVGDGFTGIGAVVPVLLEEGLNAIRENR